MLLSPGFPCPSLRRQMLKIITPALSLQLNNTLKNYSLEERARLYNLKPDRADVITNAADIFLLVAEHTQAKHIVVPTIGLVDGIIDSLYLQHHKTPEEQIPLPIY